MRERKKFLVAQRRSRRKLPYSVCRLARSYPMGSRAQRPPTISFKSTKSYRCSILHSPQSSSQQPRLPVQQLFQDSSSSQDFQDKLHSKKSSRSAAIFVMISFRCCCCCGNYWLINQALLLLFVLRLWTSSIKTAGEVRWEKFCRWRSRDVPPILQKCS